MPAAKPIRGTQLNRSHPLARGLVGCWIFNENGGNVVFDLCNKNNGAFVNSPVWAAGRFGSAIDFDSTSNQYIELGDDISILEPQRISVVAWIKAESNTTIHGITCATGNNYGYMLTLYTGKARFYIYDGGWKIAESSNLNNGQLYHLVGIFDGSIVQLYVNGILQTTTANATQIDYIGTIGHHIGQYHTYVAYDFNGIIDNTSIYNRALSAAEIQQLYREPFCMFEPKVSPAWLYAPAGGGVIDLAGTIAGVGGMAGSLSRDRAIAASAAGIGGLAGSLSRDRAIAASAVGIGGLAGALSVERKIAGLIAAYGGIAGQLTVAKDVSLAGSAAGVGTLTGSLKGITSGLQMKVTGKVIGSYSTGKSISKSRINL